MAAGSISAARSKRHRCFWLSAFARLSPTHRQTLC